MRILYMVVEITPAPGGVDARVIVSRDRREDAQLVLDALERTNYLFSTYEIRDVDIDKG